MKLSDLRTCDGCGGPIVARGEIYFLRLRVSGVLITPEANRVLGLAKVVGGSLRLAETLAPESEVVRVLEEEDPSLGTELLLCLRCYGSHGLSGVVEQRSMAIEGLLRQGEPSATGKAS